MRSETSQKLPRNCPETTQKPRINLRENLPSGNNPKSPVLLTQPGPGAPTLGAGWRRATRAHHGWAWGRSRGYPQPNRPLSTQGGATSFRGWAVSFEGMEALRPIEPCIGRTEGRKQDGTEQNEINQNSGRCTVMRWVPLASYSGIQRVSPGSNAWGPLPLGADRGRLTLKFQAELPRRGLHAKECVKRAETSPTEPSCKLGSHKRAVSSASTRLSDAPFP